MKELVTIVLFTPFVLSAQLLNGGFEVWDTVDYGWPQLSWSEPQSWQTKNYFDYNFVSKKISAHKSNDAHMGDYALLLSLQPGIDALGPGCVKQTISSNRLRQISYWSRCDTVAGIGACVVSLYGNTSGILWTDSVFHKMANYELTEVPVLDSWRNANDSISLVFTAYGYSFPLMPNMYGISLMHVDEIDASYSSSLQKESSSSIRTFPNPVSQSLHISSDESKVNKVTIVDLAGRVRLTKFPRLLNTTIDVSILTEGIYTCILHLETGEEVKDLISKQ